MMRGVIETQFVQREFDGRWEQIVRIPDPENAYQSMTDGGTVITLVPDKWLTVRVFDFLMEEAA